MGTFGGHFLPGCFMALLAAWWALSILQRYFAAVRRVRRGTFTGTYRSRLTFTSGTHRSRLTFRGTYRSRLTFRCRCWPRLPFEGMCVLAAVTLAIIDEVVSGVDDSWMRAHHVTTLLFCGVAGLLDVVYATPLSSLLPPDLDYVATVLAFGVEAALTQQRLSGRATLDKQMHSLQYASGVACACCTALELFYRGSVLPALARAFFALLHGSWGVQMAFVLHGWHALSWRHEALDHVSTVTLLFTWHVGATFVFLLVLAATMSVQSRRVNMSPQRVALGRGKEENANAERLGFGERSRHVSVDV